MEPYIKTILWQDAIRHTDVGDMSNEKKEELVIALRKAVAGVCWDYGLHN